MVDRVIYLFVRAVELFVISRSFLKYSVMGGGSFLDCHGCSRGALYFYFYFLSYAISRMLMLVIYFHTHP